MITQRIAIAIRRQDWATILIEFVLVVLGVLFALQMDRWNDARQTNERELELLIAVRTDIHEDIDNLQNADEVLTAVIRNGAIAVEAIERQACVDDCWSTLVAFFMASQWTDVALISSTYDEMRAAGQPRDTHLAAVLSRYQALGEQGTRINAELPRYRSLVRSLIPAATQQYMWANCFRVDGRLQYLVEDCAAPADGADYQAMVMPLTREGELLTSLNFWLSTVTVVKSTLDVQVTGARSTISELDTYINTRI